MGFMTILNKKQEIYCRRFGKLDQMNLLTNYQLNNTSTLSSLSAQEVFERGLHLSQHGMDQGAVVPAGEASRFFQQTR